MTTPRPADFLDALRALAVALERLRIDCRHTFPETPAVFAGSSPKAHARRSHMSIVADFAWSRDGTRLAIARATVTNDIVLFKGLR